MKTSQKLIALCAAFFLTCSTVWAQSGMKSMSWSDCVSIATKNNPALVTSEETLKANEAAEGTARSGFFPQIYGALNYSQSKNANVYQTQAGGFNSQAQKNYSATLNVSQNIFNGYADWAKLQEAKWTSQASRSDYQLSKAQVSNDLVNAYEGFKYAIDAQKLSEAIIKRREENLRLVELRFESGLENKGSVLLSQADLEQSKLELLQAKNAQLLARSQLAKVLNLDENTEFTLMDDIPVQEPPVASPDFQKIAMGTPDVQKTLAQQKSAEAGIDFGKSGFFPTLGVTGSTGNYDSTFFPEQNGWSIGATLTIPLWSGNKDISAYHQAVATSIAAQNSTTTAQATSLVKLRQTYNSYVESVEKLKVDTHYQVAAKTRADIGRNKYNNGLLNFEDWDTIENDLINREKNLIQSHRDRILNEAAWIQAKGQGVIP